MATLWLFGAGASFGSGPCTPHPPPLGAGLFKALEPRGGVWADLDTETRELFLQDFETGLGHLWSTKNVLMSAVLRDLAAYFLPFSPMSGNRLTTLVRAMVATKGTHVLSTTNYDLLLDEAIIAAGHLITYTPPPVPPKNVGLLKIHGSCHFLPDVAPDMFTNIGIDVSIGGGGILDAPITIARSRKVVERFLAGGDTVAPVIALYMRGKPVLYCGNFVDRLQSQWRNAVAAAKRLVVVGLAFNDLDTHIWGPLGDSRAPLTYVGLYPDPIRAWSSACRPKRLTVIDSTLEDALPTLLAFVRGSG